MRAWGIRARVLFLALAPSVMILLALVTYFTYTRIAEVDVALAQHGLSVARQLAPGAEFALFAGDRAALQRLTDAAARETDVASITITDARGQALAHSSRSEAVDAGESVQFTQAVMETRIPAAEFPEQLNVTAAPSKIGEITVAMSRASAHAAQRQLLLIGLGLGLAGLVVAGVLALAIGNSVIHPIRRLAGAMVELGQGKRVTPLSPSGGGEFRTLSEGFNDMASRLQAGTQELKSRIDDATRALTAQKDAAEQATSAKSRFIAAASHDLRQPLHAIGLFTSTLQRRTEGTELGPIVRDLAQAVTVMDRLFDSLLDISRLDSGTLQAEPKAFRLARVFAQVAAEYFDAAEQKRLRLYVHPTDAVVVTDELLLHRLLSNLVANAIRYTNEGTVMVCCRRRGGEVQIEVRDSGIGIAPDKQKDVFKEFYQIGNDARDRSLGLGLGLAIVARIAQLLGTQVTVRSEPGRGSVFFVRLTMPGMDGARTIAEIRDGYPSVPLIVLSGADPALDARACLRAGAAGFIPKSAMSKVMLQAIQLVLAGGQYLPPQLLHLLDRESDVSHVTAPATIAVGGPEHERTIKRQRLDLLSKRQREVFALLAQGLSNKMIARELNVTEGTVKSHIATIFDVLNVHNRVAAVAVARKLAGDAEVPGRHGD